MSELQREGARSSELLNVSDLKGIVSAIRCNQRVGGLTHEFYRYPARFSPVVARKLIEEFSKPGDLILDPFMGGGTTLVEGKSAGRNVVGTDISGLAVFISRVKTTVLRPSEYSELSEWSAQLNRSLILTKTPNGEDLRWKDLGYFRNMAGSSTWRIQKALRLILAAVGDLKSPAARRFARCVTLRTGQWALDNRKDIPSVPTFRRKFHENLAQMLADATAMGRLSEDSQARHKLGGKPRVLCFQRSAIGIEDDPRIASLPQPTLVLTSPPYPGVHVLYHRWQVQGRRETPAPFWIAGQLDGEGPSFYNFGNRHQMGLSDYYKYAAKAFESIGRLCSPGTLIAQLVAFSDASWQLPQYLQTMDRAGFREILLAGDSPVSGQRIWRNVPNRRWYTRKRHSSDSGKEVLLFHRMERNEI